MKSIIGLIFILIYLSIWSCRESMPNMSDGTLSLRVIVADGSGLMEADSALGYAPISGAQAVIESKEYLDASGTSVQFRAQTNARGEAVFHDIDASKYEFRVESTEQITNPASGMSSEVTFRGNALIDVYDLQSIADTVKAVVSSPAALVINEIYYCGPVNTSHYFYDQYVELYNAADTTVYLDGMLLCRARQYRHPDIDQMDFLQALYLYQFPGEPVTGREHPLEPGEFTVVAQDAFDHSKYGTDNAIDLSESAWEFFNPYGGDWDSPAQNVNNILPGRSTDFMINLVHNAVILAVGLDFYPGEMSDSGYEYYHIPLNRVVDVVEYSANPEKNKEITARLDAGFAGVGIGKYTGYSTERRKPGFDTNNSTLDFVNIKPPTPGYQH